MLLLLSYNSADGSTRRCSTTKDMDTLNNNDGIISKLLSQNMVTSMIYTTVYDQTKHCSFIICYFANIYCTKVDTALK